MSRERYQTKQKELIYEYLQTNKGKHIKVQDIINGLNEKGHSIGVSTVYRCLDDLVNKGLVQKYMLDGNAGACYQYGENANLHDAEYHLRCSNCGGLFHFHSEDISNLSKQMREKGINVNLENTVFSGECDTCKTKKDRKKEKKK